MEVKTFETETGEFSLPGMKTFMEGAVEYISVKKDVIKQIVEVIELEGVMIQALGTQCESQMDVMGVITDKLPEEAGVRKQWQVVIDLFADRYDKLFTKFLVAIQDSGIGINPLNSTNVDTAERPTRVNCGPCPVKVID